MGLVRRHIRRVRDIGLRRLVVAFIALAAVIGLSVTGYISSRESTNQETYFGDPDNPDRVDVTVWITRVDATAQALSVTVMDVLPNGTIADSRSNFAQDTTVTNCRSA